MMADTYRQNLQQALDDAALTLMLDEYAQYHSSLLREAALDSEPMPEALDSRCTDLIENTFRTAEKAETRRRTGIRMLRAAAYTLVTLFLAGTLVMNVDALRIPFLNFVFTMRERSSVFNFDENSHFRNDKIRPIPNALFPHIPEDYKLIHEECPEKDSRLVFYQNPEGEVILIEYIPIDSSVSADTQDCVITDISVNGHPGIYCERNEEKMAYWVDEELGILRCLYASALPKETFDIIMYTLDTVY